ncbi:MAG TPA: hypothetical protein VFB12_30965 [Ktedonobacteraceae bacterium]|nr:hypothetical protein [Ktedonobacteraceae bacterium]
MSQHDKQLFEKYQSRVREGEMIEDVIVALHAEGLTILDSIKMVRELYQLSLGEAKQVVSAHPVWKEVVQASEPLHELVEQALFVPSYDAGLEGGGK